MTNAKAKAPVKRATRGRPAFFESKKAIASALREVMAGDTLNRYLSLQLVEQGYMAVEKLESDKRGRKPHAYVVTGKGRGLVAMSANWK